MALGTTCIKDVKIKSIEISSGCQYVGYFCYSDSLNWAARGPRVGHSCAEGTFLIGDVN